MLQRHPDVDWIINLHHTQSTMLDANSLLITCKYLPDSILIVSDEQTGGIGRSNHQWISPQGGLWFTLMLHSTENHPQISLLLGLSLYQCLLKHFPFLEKGLCIKWPNDILYNDKKLAGILVQSSHNYLIIGIGINTNVDKLPDMENLQPVSLQNVLGFRISNTALLSTILTNFVKIYRDYQESGFGKFIPDINAVLWGKDQKVAIDKGLETIYGMCRGMNEDGALLLENALGDISQNYSGTIIRFDA